MVGGDGGIEKFEECGGRVRACIAARVLSYADSAAGETGSSEGPGGGEDGGGRDGPTAGTSTKDGGSGSDGIDVVAEARN